MRTIHVLPCTCAFIHYLHVFGKKRTTASALHTHGESGQIFHSGISNILIKTLYTCILWFCIRPIHWTVNTLFNYSLFSEYNIIKIHFYSGQRRNWPSTQLTSSRSIQKPTTLQYELYKVKSDHIENLDLLQANSMDSNIRAILCIHCIDDLTNEMFYYSKVVSI